MADDMKISGQSFAELMSTFARLTHLEDQINIAVEKSKIPTSEIRKFLLAGSKEGVETTPLFQYLKDLFTTLEIGDLRLLSASGMEYSFAVDDCTVCDLFPDVEGENVCMPVVELLHRFFQEDMGLENEAQEFACRRNGADVCKFHVKLKPLSVYPYILTEDDMKILDIAKERQVNVNLLAKELNRDPEYVIYRLEVLQECGLLTPDNRLETMALATLKYIKEHPPEEREFDPPWKDFASIANAIAGASSFAEALKEIAEDEPLPWEESDEEVIELREKAEKTKSFAEFLSSLDTDDEEE